MSKEILIDINGSGAMHGLHFEEMPLTAYGKARIKRATDIKWDERTQLWNINLLSPTEEPVPHHPQHLAGFADYEEARRHEVRYLQACRVEGVGTVSQAGDDLGHALRATD